MMEKTIACFGEKKGPDKKELFASSSTHHRERRKERRETVFERERERNTTPKRKNDDAFFGRARVPERVCSDDPEMRRRQSRIVVDTGLFSKPIGAWSATADESRFGGGGFWASIPRTTTVDESIGVGVVFCRTAEERHRENPAHITGKQQQSKHSLRSPPVFATISRTNGGREIRRRGNAIERTESSGHSRHMFTGYCWD
tara:strand:+ start:83 stop:685 length:603 start_codon:yes stop_codon:yes gene_type:complete